MEGVKEGYIMTHSKVSYDDLGTEAITDLGIFTHKALFVDGIKGKDTNDGLSRATALKTIKRAGEMLSHKTLIPKIVLVNINPKASYEAFKFENIKGTIILHPYTVGDMGQEFESEDKILITTAGIDLINLSRLEVKRFIFKPVAPPVENRWLNATLYVTKVDYCFLADSEFDGSNLPVEWGNAMYTDTSAMYIANVKWLKHLYAISASSLSRIVTANASYDQQAYIRLLCLAEYLAYTPGGSFTPIIIDQAGSGVDFNYLKNGVMVESGSNANGRYIKYADGTLECSTTIVAQVSTQVSEIQWTYPVPFFWDERYGFVNTFTGIKSVSMAWDLDLRAQVLYSDNSAGIMGRVAVVGKIAQQVSISVLAKGRWK